MAFQDEFGSRVLSRPIRLQWCGWETDTYRLQREGWELSAQYDIPRDRMMLAARHVEAGAKLLADIPDMDFYGQAAHSGPRHMTQPLEAYPRYVQMAQQITISHHGSLDQFAPIDAAPQIIHDGRFSRLEDVAHFAGRLVQTQTVIVEEPSVDELLARILEKQSAAKTAHFQRLVRENSRGEPLPRFKQHAQILSLVA